MDLDAEFELDSFDRRESRRARNEAMDTLSQAQDVLHAMEDLYEDHGYDAPEGIRVKVKDQVEVAGLQHDNLAGGLYGGRDERGVTEIKIPWNSGLESLIHEFSHDVIQNTVNQEDLDPMDRLTFEEAFCELNKLVFTDSEDGNTGENQELDRFCYSPSFEDTFEGLWKALNPEYVERRRKSVDNMEGSLDAMKEVEDDDMIEKLEDQFLGHLEEYRDTPPSNARINYFMGRIEFFVTQLDSDYRVPVNERRSEEKVEMLNDINKTLGEYPHTPVSENLMINKVPVNIAQGSAERLGNVSEIENWGNFVYQEIRSSRGYAKGIEEDFDLAHSVGRRVALDMHRQGEPPSEMIVDRDEYVERIQEEISKVINTWMNYQGVADTLDELELGTEERGRAVRELEQALTETSGDYSETVKELYENGVEELGDAKRERFRYALEELGEVYEGKWFTEPYLEFQAE